MCATVVAVCALFFLSACTPTRKCGSARTFGCGGSQSTELSGRWNETDARQVADKLIGGMLDSPWLQRWYEDSDEQPTVIVGPIRNKTMQHIDEEIFVKDIERNLVNADTVRFVAAADDGLGLRCKRENEKRYPTEKSALNVARKEGADFMVQGTIQSTVQDPSAGDNPSISYTVNLKLTNIESEKKIWLQETKITKIVKRSKVSR